jgi:hypothetical protein
VPGTCGPDPTKTTIKVKNYDVESPPHNDYVRQKQAQPDPPTEDEFSSEDEDQTHQDVLDEEEQDELYEDADAVKKWNEKPNRAPKPVEQALTAERGATAQPIPQSQPQNKPLQVPHTTQLSRRNSAIGNDNTMNQPHPEELYEDPDKVQQTKQPMRKPTLTPSTRNPDTIRSMTKTKVGDNKPKDLETAKRPLTQLQPSQSRGATPKQPQNKPIITRTPQLGHPKSMNQPPQTQDDLYENPDEVQTKKPVKHQTPVQKKPTPMQNKPTPSVKPAPKVNLVEDESEELYMDNEKCNAFKNKLNQNFKSNQPKTAPKKFNR